jgi:hypothetical protein
LNKNARCRSLCLASLSDLSSALNVDVGNILLFAKNWQVREYINRRNISSDNANAISKIKNEYVYPFPFLATALTVSLTPLLTVLSFILFLTNLMSFLDSLSLAKGSAMGLTNNLDSVAGSAFFDVFEDFF